MYINPSIQRRAVGMGSFLPVYDENGRYVTLIASSVGTRITKSRVIRGADKKCKVSKCSCWTRQINPNHSQQPECTIKAARCVYLFIYGAPDRPTLLWQIHFYSSTIMELATLCHVKIFHLIVSAQLRVIQIEPNKPAHFISFLLLNGLR
jgi:hypothetical protein